MKPLVSICLPVYNAAPFLPDCLNSIASQSYRPLELIAVDDASTDGSYTILKEFSQRHPWTKVYRHKRNKGVSAAFNSAVAKAKGEYVARMDADDIMNPERLSKQIAFLTTHPNTVIVGGQCHLIDKNGTTIGTKTFPTTHREIYDMLFRTVPIQQPTITINRRLLPKTFLFANPLFSPAEDYGLFFSAARYGHLANLPDFIHSYREHNTNISLVRPKFTFFRIWRARLDAITRLHYRPSLRSALTVLAQTLLIIVLPEKFIYPLHKLSRGMNR